MFRLGFRKNDEKEMLSRTIAELQELRAELSVLKDRLTMIIPDQSAGSSPDLAAAEAAASVYRNKGPAGGCPPAGPACGSGPETDWTETEITGDNGDVHILMEESRARCEAGKIEGQDGVLASPAEGYIEEKYDPPVDFSGGCHAGESDSGEKTVEDDQYSESTLCGESCMESGLSAVEGGLVKKEWAVVSFKGEKRPWWKWWGSKNHLVRRSV
ncbi:MAG: hypothetical protein ACOY30_02280 [Bacillota bacterium]